MFWQYGGMKHVGIYAGDGMMWDSPRPGRRVGKIVRHRVEAAHARDGSSGGEVKSVVHAEAPVAAAFERAEESEAMRAPAS